MTSIPPPGPHGGDAARIAAAIGVPVDDLLDLSASLNPVATPVASIVTRHLGALGRYPDATRATEALAAHMEIPSAQVLLTNGGSEAISLVTRVLGGTVYAEPDFALYPRTAHGTDGAAAPLWRSNPHSPSGVLVDPLTVPAVTVWDEAFFPMATGRWTSGIHTDGSVVIGSLTKLLGCPGLRLGYVLSADVDLHRRLGEAQPGWSVSGLASATLPDLLHTVELPTIKTRIDELRRDLVAMVTDHLHAPTQQVTAAAAPWVLVHGVPNLRDALIEHGIVVRDCATFGLPGTVRVAVPDETGMARLAVALDRIDEAALESEPLP